MNDQHSLENLSFLLHLSTPDSGSVLPQLLRREPPFEVEPIHRLPASVSFVLDDVVGDSIELVKGDIEGLADAQDVEVGVGEDCGIDAIMSVEGPDVADGEEGWRRRRSVVLHIEGLSMEPQWVTL